MAVTPNMLLNLPTPSVTLGPAWASQLNTALELVDSHDHSSGKGARVTPSGLNINADLPLGANNLTGARSLRMNSQGAVLALPSDLGCLSNVGGDLYWNNGSGAPVQVTSGGAVIAASDGIARRFQRTSTAAPLTILASDTFSYIDVDTSSSVTITLPAANAVAAGRFYEIKDVTGSAATNNITIQRAGADTIDGATTYVITEPRGTQRLVSNGTNAWTTRRDQRPQLNFVRSLSSGSFSLSTAGVSTDVTNLTATITTTGRPVFACLVPDGTASDSLIRLTQNPPSMATILSAEASLLWLRGASTIARHKLFEQTLQLSVANLDIMSVSAPCSSFSIFDNVAAGTYTYKVQINMNSTNATVVAQNIVLVLIEL